MGLEREMMRFKREIGWELEKIEGGESGWRLWPLCAPPVVRWVGGEGSERDECVVKKFGGERKGYFSHFT